MSANSTVKGTSGKQVAGLALGRWMQMVMTFVMPIFLVRFLSRNDYGLYSQFYTIALFLSSIFACAFPSGIYYFYPRIKVEERRAMLGNIFLALVLASVLCSLLIIFTPLGTYLLGSNGLYDYVKLIAIFVLLYMPATIIDPFYVVRRDNVMALFYPGAIQLLKTLAVIIAACLGGTLFYTLFGVLAAQTLISLYITVYCLWHTRECGKAPFVSLHLLKEQLLYTFPFAISGILGAVSRQFDKLICITFMAPAEYALYAVAFFGIPGIQQIYDAIGNVYLVEMSRCFHEGRKKDALETLKRLESKAISFSLPVILAVFIFAEPIVKFIFTEKYLGATGYFRLYIITFTFEVVASGLIARASGNTKLNLITGIASAVVTLPFTYFAVKYYGAWGGISGVLLSCLLQRLLYVFFEMKIVEASLVEYLPWKNFGKIFLISFAGAVPLAVVNTVYPCNVWQGGMLSAIYLLAVYSCEIKHDVFIADRSFVVQKLQSRKLNKLAAFFQ